MVTLPKKYGPRFLGSADIQLYASECIYTFSWCSIIFVSNGLKRKYEYYDYNDVLQ